MLNNGFEVSKYRVFMSNDDMSILRLLISYYKILYVNELLIGIIF